MISVSTKNRFKCVNAIERKNVVDGGIERCRHFVKNHFSKNQFFSVSNCHRNFDVSWQLWFKIHAIEAYKTSLT